MDRLNNNSYNNGTKKPFMKTILTADIGGTNSRFAHFTLDNKGTLSFIRSKWFKTRTVSSFPDLIETLETSDSGLSFKQADAAVIAVAGPVEAGQISHPPYIPWEINLSSIERNLLPKKTELINDFVAQAYACQSPIMNTLREIVPGTIDKSAPLVVIGAGTALGQAALLPLKDGGYAALPSEGGHASFPFETRDEMDYMNFLLAKTGVPCIIANTVVSGNGLSLLHAYLTGRQLNPAEIAADPAENAKTLEWMARFYGRICRNYALQCAATGGVYITGGIAAKLPEIITHPAFRKTFRESETLGEFLKRIPVFLNLNEESGLWGAALYGQNIITKNP